MKTKLNVEGMACAACEQAVFKALSAIEGVKNVLVELPDKFGAVGAVTVTHDENVSAEAIKDEIEDIGYEVVK
jgi:copper chaperone CopZ